jgi:hypothetical protein
MIMYDQVRIILPSRFLQKRQARQKKRNMRNRA